MNAEARPEEEPAGEMMKILIAYDGSGGSDEMLADLRRAGLPGKAEAMVISISEAWFLLSGAPPWSRDKFRRRGRR